MQFRCHLIEYHIKNSRKDQGTIIHPIHCYGSGCVICITAMQRSQPEAKLHPLQAVQMPSETSLEQRACHIHGEASVG